MALTSSKLFGDRTPLFERSGFAKKLENLPYAISGCECTLVFHNGPLPISENYLKERPEPKIIKGRRDDVAYTRVYCSGSMLSSLTKSDKTHRSVSSGLLLEKGDDRPLTCSYHFWEAPLCSNQRKKRYCPCLELDLQVVLRHS